MTQENTSEKLAYTINGFCAAVGIGRNKTYDEISAGRLRALKVGRRTLIRRCDAEAWLNSLEASQEATA